MGEAVDRSFVGRVEELRALTRKLEEAKSSPRIVTLLGAAGTGKTTLAARLRNTARHAKTIWVSGEGGFPDTLRQTLHAEVPRLGRGEHPDLVVLDGFERVHTIAPWFFHTLLPSAGARVLVVATSRRRLPAKIRTDLRVGSLHEELVLAPLSPAESRELLTSAGVPEAHHASIVRFTGGLPLALALVLERYRAEPGFSFSPQESGDIVSVLMEAILADASHSGAREAIDALSIVATADRELLQRMLGDEQGADAHAYLGRLAFVRNEQGSLTLHDWARSVAYADLASRRPNELGRLAERAISELVERARDTGPARTRELTMQALLTRRDRPEMQQLGLDVIEQTTLRHLEPDDLPTIEASLTRFESEASIDAFRRWYAARPQCFYVLSDLGGRIIGFIGHVPTADDDDPLLAAANAMAAAIPKDDELEWDGDVYCFRWFYSLDTHMELSPSMAAVMLSGPLVTTWTEPVARYAFFLVPPAWAPLAESFLVEPFDAPPVHAFGREHQPFLLDLGAITEYWAQPQEIMRASLHEMVRSFLRPVLSLDRATFEEAVKEAMGVLHDPAALERTELARATAIEDADAAAIASFLRAGVSAMGRRPTQRESHDVLHHTYIQPAVKQRAAAADLGLPFGTYRYRLRRALAALSDELWRIELRARSPR